MGKGRLEAFSDGVIAIIITIMVLELKVPRGADAAALLPLMPVLFAYVLSFVYTAIYWNNHHHMFLTVKEVNGAILWANAHLLFWLSVVPFVTAWAGENHFASTPTAYYGFVLLMAGTAYFILQSAIIASQGHGSLLAKAVGADFKGKASMVIYTIAVACACFHLPALACALYVMVAVMWLIPDRRIERSLAKEKRAGQDSVDVDSEADETDDPQLESPMPSNVILQNRDIYETRL